MPFDVGSSCSCKLWLMTEYFSPNFETLSPLVITLLCFREALGALKSLLILFCFNICFILKINR